MKLIVGVKLEGRAKIFYFDPGGLELKYGDRVLVEGDEGQETGRVELEPQHLENDNVLGKLKKVIEKIGDDASVKNEEILQKQEEAFSVCEEKITAHGLNMKLIDAEYAQDGSKIVFYFSADGRVDFRELVKDLASEFKTRIELRQIGVRDEARKIGGLGPCGRPCCCNAFLNDFQPVSIKMAKDQNLSLSPTKISGLCGRLMCCLNYENDFYKEMKKKLPHIGSAIITPDGEGEVLECNSIKETVRAKVTLADGTVDMRTYPVADIKWHNKHEKPKEPQQNGIHAEADQAGV